MARLGRAVFLAAAVLGLGVSAVASGEADLEWTFKVFLDDKEIGTHDFRVSGHRGEHRVETVARFDVKFLFFNAFRYRHQAVETWAGDVLLSIQSETDNNGEQLQVDGSRESGHFLVETESETRRLPEEVMSFAYWNPEILDESRLLNAQTGEYEKVQIEDRGVETVPYEGQRLEARRHDIVVQGKAISVWYAVSDQRWLALETPVKGGRVLRYEPQSVPESALFVAAVARPTAVKRDGQRG